MIMKKTQLNRLFFRLSHARSSGTKVFYSVDFSPATITTVENRAFDLMWISLHHESVFRFPARLPGLVAKAGCSSLRIPRLSVRNCQSFPSPTGILLLSAFFRVMRLRSKIRRSVPAYFIGLLGSSSVVVS